MKNLLYAGVVLLVLVLLQSCREDFEFSPSTGNLTFSKDTVYLDTVFTSLGTSTYTLKVYNRSLSNIKIPLIGLAQGSGSSYRIMVDGLSGHRFQDIEILAKDSMFVFIEAQVDLASQKQVENSFLYTDQLLFHSSGKTQKVELVTLIKDAYFLYPKKNSDGSYHTLEIDKELVPGFNLSEKDPLHGNTLHLKADKPYVIYGFAAVPKTKTLVIDPGAELYFHHNSGLIAFETARITAHGSVENPISFKSNRLDYSYRYIPGQWKGIRLSPGSQADLSNVIIENPIIGLQVDHNQGVMQLKNLQIYNASQVGLLAQGASIEAQNVVIGNAGSASLALTQGGSYSFIHSSFVNQWPSPNPTAVLINDKSTSNKRALEKVVFANSILYSHSNQSLVLQPKEENPADFPIYFHTNLIKFYDSYGITADVFPYDFQNPDRFESNYIQKPHSSFYPVFASPEKNQLQLLIESVGILGVGHGDYTKYSPEDITGKSRVNNPDLGAYQHQNSTKD